MRKTRSSLISPLLFLKKGDFSDVLWKRIYLGIRYCIEDKKLSFGTGLPSTRQLANELGISRNTVISAYEQLKAEGYLESRKGSGTFVSLLLPELPDKTPVVRDESSTSRGPRLSRRGESLEQLPVTFNSYEISPRPFQHNLPALDSFPFEIWKKLAAKKMTGGIYKLFLYGNPAGYLPLREALHQYLTQARGVSCSPEEIIITNGSQQSLDLVSKVIFDWGDKVIFEDPGHPGAKAAFISNGVSLVPVPLDDAGLRISGLSDVESKVKAIYVTPSHQYPSGVTMSLKRRIELLNFTSEKNLWIIEDDEDSEFRYESAPLPALQGLPPSERVIYLGSFSKKLFPGLRLGYAVVPQKFKDAFIRSKTLIDRQSPQFDQAVLADFIGEGHFGRHIKRMRKLYSERLKVVLEELRGNLPSGFEAQNTEAGMHMIIRVPQNQDDRLISSALREIGIEASPLSNFCEAAADRGLLIGFAGFREEILREEIRKLTGLLKTISTQFEIENRGAELRQN